MNTNVQLYVALKLMSMITWALFGYGGCIAFAGFYGAAHVGLTDDGIGDIGVNRSLGQQENFDAGMRDLQEIATSEQTLFHLLAAVGCGLIFVGLWVAICVQIDELCIQNDEFCIQNDDLMQTSRGRSV